MTNSGSTSAFMGSYFLNSVPSLVRAELLSDAKFLKELGFECDPLISFKDKNIAFSRNALFKAIRSAFENIEKAVCLNDINNKTWFLRNHQGMPHTFSLTDGNIQIYNNNFWMLCGDINQRLRIFDIEAKNRRISKEDRDRWISVLSESKLSDEDISDILLDLDSTPSHFEALLRQELHGSSHMVATLVPNALRYYERLVGKYCGSIDIDEYSNNELKQYFDSKIESKMTDNDFLLCMHMSISKIVSIGSIDKNSYQSIANRAIETYHPILLISCLEIGVLRFADSTDSTLKALFDCISSVKTLENLRQFCAIMIFIDGELSRLQIFRNFPPFYRRLASLVHSALIVKVLLEEGFILDKAEQWGTQRSGIHFLCQNLIDLRKEPRWLPSYLTAEKFIGELFGRINNICQEDSKYNTIDHIQKKLIYESQPDMSWLLPGPLEGNSVPEVAPNEISNLLAEIMKGEASLETLRVLMNSTLCWKIDDEYLEHTISLFESVQHKLTALNNKDAVYEVLSGMARVSCMTRSKKFASSVTILSRLYRDYIDVDSAPEDYLAIGVVAGAAFDDIDDWAEFIGHWCTELVYLSINEDAIKKIGVMLERLCILEPYLYHTCSKSLDILKMLSSK